MFSPQVFAWRSCLKLIYQAEPAIDEKSGQSLTAQDRYRQDHHQLQTSKFCVVVSLWNREAVGIPAGGQAHTDLQLSKFNQRDHNTLQKLFDLMIDDCWKWRFS
jgi:hypothetical protein